MKELIKKINLEYLLLGIILLFGFFIRVYKLGLPSLWVDESISTIVSLNIIEKGLPILDSGLFYDRAYLFHYLQSFFLLLGNTEFLARFSSVLFGLATIFLIYKIGKEYSTSGGIIAALFLAVFYLEVFYSRQSRFYQLFQLTFFLSLYLLYKSRNNDWYLYGSMVVLFIAIDTQIAGLILTPFFIIHIAVYNKKWKKYLASFPALLLIREFLSAKNLSAGSTISAVNYASRYASYTDKILYIFILFIPGVILGFFKKKRLTSLIILPSIILLIGVFSLQTFAIRYVYFAVFPLILYSSLLISFLYEKYGNIILISIFMLLIIPSNIFFPYTSVNILKPIDYGLYDSSAPTTNYKDIPYELLSKLRSEDNILISYFSPDVEWYLKKPDYVLSFLMNGKESSNISLNSTNGLIDRYSGSPILGKPLEESYYLIADKFSTSKLRPSQRKLFNNLSKNCSKEYSSFDLIIFYCSKQ